MSPARLLPILLLALLPACRSARRGDEAEAGGPASGANVTAETAAATRGPFAITVQAIATVAPRPGSFVSMGAPAPTRVSRVYVSEGDSVRPGQPLVGFEPAAFDAELDRAASARNTAQRAYDRARRLSEQGILPRKEVDQTASDLAQAEAAWVSARRAQELSTLRSPIAGIVARMSAVANSPVDATQPLVEVVDPSALELVLVVSPAEAGLVHSGAPVTVAEQGDTTGAELGRGVVIAVSPTVDSLGRGVQVRARVTAHRRPLRVGEGLPAVIEVAVHRDAVSIPAAALVPEGDAFKVFVVDSSDVAHSRPVTVGGRWRNRVEVLAGLREGEIVVTEGAYGVEDGTRIRRPAP